MMITPLKAGEGQLWEASHFLRDSWLGTCPIATSSLRRECWWHMSCWHHQCPYGVVTRDGSHSWLRSQTRTMLVVVRQEKLLEKLNLDGLAHWSLRNAVVARDLVLAYHDVFVLESNELGCTSAIEHEIRIDNSKPFKKWFRYIPPPLLEEVHTLLQDMLDAGVIHPSQSPWCNAVVLVRKKDGTLHFCVNFRHLNI